MAAQRIDSVRLADAMNSLIEAAGKESIEKRTRAKLLLGMATEFLNDTLRVSAGASAKHLDASQQSVLDTFASRHSPETIATLIERCLDADHQIDRKGSVPLVIEAWADDVARV